jgi:RecB family exonuclease
MGGRVKGALESAEAGEGVDAQEDAQLWAQSAAVARTLERLLISRPPTETMPERTLFQLHDVALGEGAELAAFESESGRPAVVTAPGGLSAPAADILWWGFVGGDKSGANPDPWSEAERAALTEAGVTLAPPGEHRQAEADNWQETLLQAKERVVLVRWRLSGAELVPPHPYLDELDGRLAEGWLEACTVTSEKILQGIRSPWPAANATLVADVPMSQKAVWKVPPAALILEKEHSATSLESFLGCPFQWALKYPGRLEPSRGMNLPSGSTLSGTFAHGILQEMLCGPSKLPWESVSEAAAKDYARAAFDRRVALEAAPLVKRGAEANRDRLREQIAAAAADLVRLLKRGGWRPVSAEHPVTGTFAGEPAKGYVDLVLENGKRQGLLDMKFGSGKYRKSQLENGQGVQLALYASLLASPGGQLPPSGYFVIIEGKFFTLHPDDFPGSSGVEGPTVLETLRGAERVFRYWRGVLDHGILPVPREELPWREAIQPVSGDPPSEGDPGVLELPCRFCNFSQICTPPELKVEDDA